LADETGVYGENNGDMGFIIDSHLYKELKNIKKFLKFLLNEKT
jgi:hypothetical protein